MGRHIILPRRPFRDSRNLTIPTRYELLREGSMVYLRAYGRDGYHLDVEGLSVLADGHALRRLRKNAVALAAGRCVPFADRTGILSVEHAHAHATLAKVVIAVIVGIGFASAVIAAVIGLAVLAG